MTGTDRNNTLFAISVAVIIATVVILVVTRFLCVLLVAPVSDRVTAVESAIIEHEVRIDALEVNVAATIKQIAEYEQRRANLATQ